MMVSAAAPTRRRILVIEDNPLNMKLFSDLITARGHEVLQAVTGNDGIKLAYEHHPDLIITDIRLPDASGLTLARLFKHDHRTRAIPILVVSASGIAKEDALQSGCDALLRKPIIVEEFLRMIDGFLGPLAA